jgi:thiamine-monophosphate kinase
MKLCELGEFGLINRIASLFLKNFDPNLVGIGDDCAVVPFSENESLLVTTDLLIEDIHFLREKITPEELGHKSLAVNLSDIAAMGGFPQSAYLSLGLPKDTEVAWLDRFFAGIYRLSESTDTPLLGGDTTKSLKSIIINIVILGKAEPSKIKYRSTAKPGDIICVTGYLGDSGGGLNVILGNLENEMDENMGYLVHEHHNPRPHLPEGQWLAKQTAVHAMLDVSDGIDSDITRIMEQSHIGAKVNLENLPLSSHLIQTCKKYGWNAYEIAATAGEDYCLLCTVDRKEFSFIADAFEKDFGRKLAPIGEITEQIGVLEYFHKREKIGLREHGFDHFRA